MTEVMDVKPTEAPVTETTTWHGDEYADLVKAKGWDGANDALKGYAELEKFKGIASGEHIVIPKSADDFEGWNKVFTAIGKPESADKYEFNNDTGIELSEDLMKGFKDFAHSANYTQKQLEGAIQFQLEAVKAGDELYATQQTERKTENIEAMKQKWQTDYEPTVTKIDTTAEKLGVKAYFENLGIDKEPEIVNMLLTIANSDSEDTLDTDNDPPPVATTLQDKLKEIMASDEYNQRFHLGHKAKMQEYMDLNMQIANAGQGKAPQ